MSPVDAGKDAAADASVDAAVVDVAALDAPALDAPITDASRLDATAPPLDLSDAGPVACMTGWARNEDAGPRRTLLADDYPIDGVADMAVDDSYVYWTANTNCPRCGAFVPGTGRAAKGGGGVEALSTGGGHVLTMGADALYVSIESVQARGAYAIYDMPKTGIDGGLGALIDNGVARSVAYLADTLRWIRVGFVDAGTAPATLFSVGTDGGRLPPVDLGDLPVAECTVTTVSTDGADLYGAVGPTVLRFPAGGAPQRLWSHPDLCVSDLLVDESRIYALGSFGVTDPVLFVLPDGAGMPTALAVAPLAGRGVSFAGSDAEYVYWRQQYVSDWCGNVFATPKAGGTTIALAEGSAAVADETGVYWAERSDPLALPPYAFDVYRLER